MISRAVLVVTFGLILHIQCKQGQTPQAKSTSSMIPRRPTAPLPPPRTGLLAPPFPASPLMPSLPPTTQFSYQPPIVPPTPTQGNLIDQWLNQSLLKTNLQSLMRLSDNFEVFSCANSRCGKQERRLTSFNNKPKCFCDEKCVLFKDCCFDYEQRCKKTAKKSKTDAQSSCKYMLPSTYFGVVVVNSCLSKTASSHIGHLCNFPNKTDLLTTVPVLDLSTNTTFGNVFCASCSRKTNISLWTVEASCNKTQLNSGHYESQRERIVSFIHESCSLTVYPRMSIQLNHKVCIPRLHSKKYDSVNDSSVDKKLKEFCDSYAFPMCSVVPDGTTQWFKNPHCMLYQGLNNFDDAQTTCPFPLPLPPLTIFFDFLTTAKYAISSQQHNESQPKEIENRHVSCPKDQGYDVFSGRCRIFYTDNSLYKNRSNTNSTTSCKFIKLNHQEYYLFENGSLLFRGKFALKKNFYQVNGTVFLCTNLTQNYTIKILASTDRTTSANSSILMELTIAGFALSIVGLLILIGSYWVLPDLRNLPGKILRSLATTMLCYIVLYFFINRSELFIVCELIGKGLHFCLLSTFFWMNVMAFDIHCTFTRKGQKNNRSHAIGCLHSLYCRYAVYAWLVPALIVATSFGLERTHAMPNRNVSDSYCFINNVYNKIYTLALPVGIILTYNCIALSHTAISIWKVQKQTKSITNQSRQPDLPMICVKMTSVMGITWILGFASSFKELTYLHYLYVLLNSLQGFLIFVSYVLNKRVLKMYRAYFNVAKRKSRTVVSKRSTNISPIT